jgi:hypothetical protein
LYFVFDELIGKEYIGKKNNSMKYIEKIHGKNRLK